jgi:ABC-type transporter Mla MlaB component
VDCWIGVQRDNDKCLVRLAGSLTHAQVPELLRACEACPSIVLDLSDLVNADTAGVDAVRQLRGSGASLVGASGYIQIKLGAQP